MKFFLPIYIFTFFLDSYFLDLGFALKPFMIFTALVVAINFNKLKISLCDYEYIMLFFFFFYISTAFVGVDYESSLRLALGIVLLLLTYFTVTYALNYYSARLSVESAFYYGYLLFIVISLILYFWGLLIVNGDFYSYNSSKIYGVMIDRHIPRMIGVTNDPNFFAFYLTPFLLYFYSKKDKSVADIALLILSLLLLFLSFSRGAMLSVFFVIVLYETIRTINPRHKIRFVNKSELLKSLIRPFLLISVFVCSALYLVSLDNVVEMVSARVESAADASGRLDIWKNGFALFVDNFILGIGIYNFQHYNIQYFNDWHYMHNTHLEVLVESGLIGALLYISFNLLLFLRLFRLSLDSSYFVFALLAYIAMMIQLTGLSGLINEVWILCLAYFSYVIKSNKRRGPVNGL
ncbi:O-antigen ligase family protein [Salinivibrio kushneri]|uniref:O-antigen ligase family protein n=1 Tax=Salinivibrio kushneri TaxID=1908198 RepID=UPI0009D0ABF2|nr:O-antigen ligase family protein [Salinivibrio kushneri]OOE62350.1 hypothetical protein BZG18_05250 [Salinivibrio kushneri]